MGTIPKHLQAQTDNATFVNLSDVTAVTTLVDTALIMVDPVYTVVQPVDVSQPLFQTGPNRFVAVYLWGMPYNYTPQFASGKEKIRDIEGFSAHGLNARELCLVSNVVLSQKFKVLDLPKYRGLSCPRSYITMYCRKRASYIDNDELLIHYFQDSLYGASLDWYMNLELGKIRTWKDLSKEFLNQYKYNLDMAPTRLQLQSQSQRSNETFEEYA
ncbi:uncharacterized protein LOC127137761 [Lathyrus oleraceus]|uniref:uncharacterized protein LOC127137761 n=1 Tax=Pisum sativum TaxID=3888 RepID=UPI0021CF16F2|nr:uncharacterized protein LOC127137761 [Pisum sativum]